MNLPEFGGWPHLLPLRPLDLQEHPLPRPLILQEHPLPRPLILQEHPLPRPLILQEHPRPPLPRPLILQEHPLPRPPLPRTLILKEHPLPRPPLPRTLILKEHPLPRPPLPGPPLKLQDQPLPPYPHQLLYLWTLMNSFNDFLIDDSDEEEEGKDKAFGALEIDVFPVCKTAEDLSALQKDLGDWISECGVPGIFSATIGEIPKIYAYVVKHYIFLRTAKMVNQLTEGMNAFGNLWDLVRNNWIAFLPCFTNMRTPLTKSSFKAILKYEYSPRGTHHREKEEDTIYSWELVLNIIEDKLTELTFEDLLIFITGADEVPTLGFPNKPSIDFYTQEAGVRRLPYASTCAMTLFLPRGITEEQELHNILNQSVKDSWGFLKV
ncbi:hypothetical protein F7725_007750 [Dissostichus mawsoni]|uniref:HECT domain-containing protein n=1 Tax=Dissostichus mawsoni TaxID=36200 RepID=A0A7J5Y7H0_DISMA|nr:hypothetical protein F7725_007750 [Dissostichus mawsoni]